MGKPPGHDDDRDSVNRSADRSAGVQDDPDRAAILARRQRFIALALSGLATTTACEKPKADPSAPKDGKAVQEGKGDEGAPHPCLNVAPLEPEGGDSTGKPMPCLDVSPPEPEPIDDGSPQACLKIAAPPPEPEPKPQPCLKVRPPEPEPEPKPQPCLKVRPPEPEPKPQPCLRVAKPT